MYTVKIQDFEGPLDLLLFFIKRDELDIYNIPIARISKEFLGYLHFMQQLDLEVAGEFLVMAAELMQIKVRMLLPPEPGQLEEEDPRANLVLRLVEYKRFKELAEIMKVKESQEMMVHYRGFHDADERNIPVEEAGDIVRDVTFFDLISSFRFAMDRIPQKFVHEVIRLNVTIDEQIAYIIDFFSRRSEATFFELVQNMVDRIRVVVTFIALLEVIRSRKVIVRQAQPFGEVSIIKNVI